MTSRTNGSDTEAPPEIIGPLSLLARLGERRPFVAVLGVVLLGLVVRYPLLFERDVWLDEIYVHVMVDGPFSALGDRVRAEDRFPPLFHMLCYGVTTVLDDPKAIRLVSLVAGLATIPMAWLFGRQLFGATAGWALAVLLAVCPPAVFYSREARPFALGLFLLFAFFASIVTLYRRPTRQAVGVVCIVTVAAILTQYANIVVIAVTLGLALLATVGVGFKWSRWLGVLLVVFGIWLVATAYVYVHFAAPQITMRGTGTGQFDRNFYDIRELSKSAQFAINQTTELLNYGLLGGNLGPKWLLLTMSCVVVALVAAAMICRCWLARFGMLVALATVLVFLLLAGIGKHPYGGIRHCLILTPLILATMAGGIRGLATRTNRPARIAAELLFAALVGLMLYGVVRVIPAENRYQFSEVVPTLIDRSRPNDVLFVTGRYDSVAVGHVATGDLRTAFRVLHDAMKADGGAVALPPLPLPLYAMDLTDRPAQKPNPARAVPVRFQPVGRIWVTDTFRTEPAPRPVRNGLTFTAVDEILAPGARATCWQFDTRSE